METKIQKWGNSLGVRLPKALAQKQSLKEGARVVVTESKKGLSIEVVKETKETFDSLVNQITPENRHDPADWGEPIGREVW